MTDIVVRNKFTNLNNQSNGNTPSEFVKTYTLRKSATELVYPVSTDDHDQPYVYTDSRESQVQAFNLNRETVEVDYLSSAQSADLYSDTLQMEGRCFNLNHLSLATSLIEETTTSIQKAFDEAHTVLLMVVSFDTNFLRNKGVLVKEDTIRTYYNPRGAVANQTDELKLRSAVKHGLNKLTETLGYTKPIAIGSIQLDTDNPHAHIVLTETAPRHESNAKLFYDGLEWGTLSPQQIDVFSKAIEFDLNQTYEVDAHPSTNITNTLDRTQSKIASLSNIKLYAQVAALSILPEDNVVAINLKNSISDQVGLSRKHTHNVVTEAKKATANNPTTISPYLKIQVTPLANQFDLSDSLQKFSKKKKIRDAKQKLILEAITRQFQQSTHVMRNPNYSEEQNLLAKLKLTSVLYDKAENDRYVYQNPVSEDIYRQYKEDFEELSSLVADEKPSKHLTLAKEQLLETSVNAVIDRLLSSQDVDTILASNFETLPQLKRFVPIQDEASVTTTKQTIDLTIEQMSFTTTLPKVVHTPSDKLVATSKLVLPTVTTDTTIDEALNSIAETDGIYEYLQTTAEHLAELEPPESPDDTITIPTLSRLEQLFVLEEPISKALINNATLRHDDALEILHRNSEIERTYGPDF